MNSAPTPSRLVHGSSLPSFRSFLHSAAKFWEPRRVLYTLLLAAVFAAWVVLSWPHFRPAMTPVHLMQFAVLGILANVCYTSAYLLDVPLQRSFAGASLLRSRWALWIVGTLLATLLENYWIADEIYPYVR